MKRHRAIGLLATVPFMMDGRPARAQALSAEQRADLTELVARASDAPQSIGFTVAIARDWQTVYAAARGKRTLEPDADATVDTWYGIGSVTKQFTAALVMQLVEAERLHLDDRLATVLDSFPHAGEITIRQLLTHTSGLAEYATEIAAAGIIDRSNVRPAELVPFIAGKPLEFAPGTRWDYSNTNYLALGLVLEKLSGKTYETLVRERITAPLGLHVNAGPPSGAVDEVRVARGYTEGTPPKPMIAKDASWAYAAGELYADAGGLLAWDAALFGGRVVNERSLALMTTPVTLPDGTSTHYGFGLSVVTLAGRPIVSHNGGVPGGFASQNFVFPHDRTAVVTLANTLDFNVALPATRLAEPFFPGLNDALNSFSHEQLAALDDPRIRARAQAWLEMIQAGKADMEQLTSQMQAAWTPAAVEPARQLLRSGGKIQNIRLAGYARQGGLRVYIYRVEMTSATFTYTFALDERDRIAGLFLKP